MDSEAFGTCRVCGVDLDKRRRVVCSRTCRNAEAKRVARDRAAKRGVPSEVPTPTIGAMSELVVSVDLMLRGWSVYRAMSPAAWADVLAFPAGRPQELRLFEVRTGQRMVSGKTAFSRTPKDEGKAFAIVIWEAGKPQVEYYPPL